MLDFFSRQVQQNIWNLFLGYSFSKKIRTENDFY